ncbi:MAG: hypothetical protein ABI969_05495 [bacterium]
MRIARPSGVKLNWQTVTQELLVTFVGVLMALGVSAIWTARQERAKEHTALEQLLATTRENEHVIAQAIYEDSSTAAIVTALRNDVDASASTQPRDSIAVWLGWSAFMSTFEPLTGTYAALVSSGDINLIRNAALRAEIVTYAGQLDGKIQALRVFESVGVANFLASYSLIPRPVSAWWAQPKGPAPDVDAMRHDERITVLLTQRFTTARNRVNRLRRLQTQTVELRKALETALHVQPAPTAVPHPFREGMHSRT